jgi:ribosomal protein S27E
VEKAFRPSNKVKGERMNDLKPCPFCGNEVVNVSDNWCAGEPAIKCNDCGAVIMFPYPYAHGINDLYICYNTRKLKEEK